MKSKDEQDVENFVQCLGCFNSNPFCDSMDNDSELVSLCSCVTTPCEVKDGLLSAYGKGSDAMQKFFSDRLLSNEVGLFDEIPEMKLNTFTSILHPQKSKSTSSQIFVTHADRSLLVWLTMIAQARSLDLKEALQYELGSFPWSLSSVDGSLRKTERPSFPTSLKLGQLLYSLLHHLLCSMIQWQYCNQ